MAPICKLPTKNGNNGYKWPKLSEAYEYCFNEPLTDAHDALSDVHATRLIYNWLSDVENTCQQPERNPLVQM